MNNYRLIILFFLQRNRINKQNKCPIRCRITFNKKRKEFSTGLFINPDYWNSKKQKAFPLKNNEFTNSQLSLISQKIRKAFLILQIQDENFDVEDIYLAYKGKNTKRNKTFMEVLNLHLNIMKKLIGKEYSPRYYQKWEGTQRLLKEFIQHKYQKNDIVLGKMTMKFLNHLDFYLKSEKKHKQITINKCIQRVRQVIKLAIAEGFLDKDPFILYKPKRVIKKLTYLTTEELILLEQTQLKQKRLQDVKNLFVFCCYTGLAYAEMSMLAGTRHINMGFDGNLWIEMYRQKTKSKISVPLLPKAKEILLKYEYELPKISNQKFNSYLKEIAEVVGIEKNLTHHVARKTFATTVLLYNGVPMEIVSELLGHSKISITQEHYARVVKKKVSDEVKKLNKKLGQE